MPLFIGDINRFEEGHYPQATNPVSIAKRFDTIMIEPFARETVAILNSIYTVWYVFEINVLIGYSGHLPPDTVRNFDTDRTCNPSVTLITF